MRQRINFSFILIKQLDSNKFENKSEIDINDEKKRFHDWTDLKKYLLKITLLINRSNAIAAQALENK